ncbi:MAG: endonuclease III [Flavobacteriales bacterium]|nr:endonuclease III [Flavobacteriales bacterium]
MMYFCLMNKKERYHLFVDHFSKHQPEAETELEYKNPYELLVAVILSAQCTDKRVNIVTKDLFKRFPEADSLAEADVAEVFEYIKSISYPNNKSKHLVGMAKILVNEFKNVVPSSVTDLQTMPGVGRKTANVIASVIYNVPVMAVDTHVFRVSARVGLTTNAKTPLEAELQLVKHIPESVMNISHHWLILHGRYVCQARKPKCDECQITHFCKYYKKS